MRNIHLLVIWKKYLLAYNFRFSAINTANHNLKKIESLLMQCILNKEYQKLIKYLKNLFNFIIKGI